METEKGWIRARGVCSPLDTWANGGVKYSPLQGTREPWGGGGVQRRPCSQRGSGSTGLTGAEAGETQQAGHGGPGPGTDPSLAPPFGTALPAARRPASRPARLSVCSLLQALGLKEGRTGE